MIAYAAALMYSRLMSSLDSWICTAGPVVEYARVEAEVLASAKL